MVQFIKKLCVVFLIFSSKVAFAHQPNLSSLMIYEQNGKKLLVIKSSIGAFEGQIDYLYTKNSYKTPEEFQQLVIKYFQENCVVVINNDTIKFLNPKVILGHETTVFAELENVPANIKTVSVSNTLFKDMPNNVCELILTSADFPKKQYILNADNFHQVNLKLEGEIWKVEKPMAPPVEKSNYLVWALLALFTIASFAYFFIKRKKTTLEVSI